MQLQLGPKYKREPLDEPTIANHKCKDHIELQQIGLDNKAQSWYWAQEICTICFRVFGRPIRVEK